MKEIRLTFRADDFSAVSEALIGMGIGFHVEPVEEGPVEAAPPRSNPPAPPLKKRPAKKNAKPRPKPQPQKRDEIPLSGADRLRSALARNQGVDIATLSQPAVANGESASPGDDNS